jgi:hypothetical protein
MTLPAVRSIGHVLRVLCKLHSKFGSVILIKNHYYHDILRCFQLAEPRAGWSFSSTNLVAAGLFRNPFWLMIQCTLRFERKNTNARVRAQSSTLVPGEEYPKPVHLPQLSSKMVQVIPVCVPLCSFSLRHLQLILQGAVYELRLAVSYRELRASSS